MAKAPILFPIQGSLGDLIIYKMEGSPGLIVRRKGSVPKQRLKKHARFEANRRCMIEFGGRSGAAGWIRHACGPLGIFFGQATAGMLNKWLVPVQKLDTEGVWGRRHVLLSKDPSLLQGFYFKEAGKVEEVIKTPLAWEMDRASLSATLEIPQLLPGINFTIANNYPFCQVTAALGIVPDVFLNERAEGYLPQGDYSQFFPATAGTGWFSTRESTAAQAFDLQLSTVPENDAYSLMLTVSVQFGNLGAGGVIKGVKRTANARILGLK